MCGKCGNTDHKQMLCMEKFNQAPHKKKKTPKTHGLVLGGVFSVSALIPYTE